MMRTTRELAPTSPSFHAAPAGGRLATTHDLASVRPLTWRMFGGIGFRDGSPPAPNPGPYHWATAAVPFRRDSLTSFFHRFFFIYKFLDKTCTTQRQTGLSMHFEAFSNLSAYLAERFNPCHGNLCDNPLPLPTTRFPKPFRQAFFAIWDNAKPHRTLLVENIYEAVEGMGELVLRMSPKSCNEHDSDDLGKSIFFLPTPTLLGETYCCT
ncbi:hypothetical protein AVEN_115050-1 [Araneus ventricosus]|uniref:Uncharacterized protein n=1 Tax=Araneus ventricosus TaxID=182803 RepID=A0A4Y1ZY22_ARAVE|nr:hypothetical protein AVEN_115050-1 [Araneus ventricosus]